MRRILVDGARRRNSLKRGGELDRHELDDGLIASPQPGENVDLQALDEALIRLAEADPTAAELVKLRYFAGLTMDEAAKVLKMSPRSAYYAWTYARSWLHREMRDE